MSTFIECLLNTKHYINSFPVLYALILKEACEINVSWSVLHRRNSRTKKWYDIVEVIHVVSAEYKSKTTKSWCQNHWVLDQYIMSPYSISKESRGSNVKWLIIQILDMCLSSQCAPKVNSLLPVPNQPPIEYEKSKNKILTSSFSLVF